MKAKEHYCCVFTGYYGMKRYEITLFCFSFQKRKEQEIASIPGRDKTLGDFFTATAGARCAQAGPDTTFIPKKKK